MTKRIFITGASGCIGHYICESLIQQTEYELYLLVRNPDKLKFDYNARPGINILTGNLRDIEKFSDILKTVDQAVLTATAWGDPQETFDTNVTKTIRLMELLDPNICQQVIYFSTASVLGNNNQILKQAGELGTDYVRTKYECLNRLSTLAIAPKITTLFPTLVLGGDANKPYSHISSGLPEIAKWINLIRFFSVDGSFHFIHGQDIAQVVQYLINHPLDGTSSRQLVLGNQPLTINQAIEEVCKYLDKKIYLRLPLSFWLAKILIVLFRIQMADWDRFCMEYRHFTYKNFVNPSTFGMQNYCATLTDVLKINNL